MAGYFDKKEKTETFSKIFEEEKKTDVKTSNSEKDNSQYGSVDIVELKNICQVYKNNKGKDSIVFDGFDFSIKDVANNGQFVVLVGASGCGKSTILRYISGLQKPTSGEIFIDGKLKTNKDRVGMVFQQYSSFPWATVLQNVALSLELKGVPKKEREERAMEMIKLVGLDGHENKFAQYPTLSGGQLQRVAVARNLVSGDKIMLLDEPNSGLDVKTKREMGDLLKNVWNNLKNNVDVTFLMVTHDLQEAVYLADKIYVMDANPGRIVEEIKIELPTERNKLIKREKRFNDYVYYLEDLMISLKSK